MDAIMDFFKLIIILISLKVSQKCNDGNTSMISFLKKVKSSKSGNH
jgi:hypothetical protein